MLYAAAIIVTALLSWSQDLKASGLMLNDIANILPHPYLYGNEHNKKASAAFPKLSNYFPAQALNEFKALGLNTEHSKLISYRFVPCREERNSLDCERPELRLIFQPFYPDKHRYAFHAGDEAIHVFFSLDKGAFKRRLIEHATQIRLKKHANPSTIEPDQNFAMFNNFNNVVYDLNYVKKLNEFLLATVAEATPYRVTFLRTQETTECNPGKEISLEPNPNKDVLHLEWFFGGFQIDKGYVLGRSIELSTGHTHTESGHPVEFIESFNGLMQNAKGLESEFEVLGNGRKLLSHLKNDPGALYAGLVKIENPSIHHAGTMSCLACHLASPVRLNVIERLSKRKMPIPSYARGFEATLKPYASTNLSEKEVTTLHMFSYLNMLPVVSQRVVNDTVSARRIIYDRYFTP